MEDGVVVVVVVVFVVVVAVVVVVVVFVVVVHSALSPSGAVSYFSLFRPHSFHQ